MSPRSQHPAAAGSPRVTTRHPARSIHQHNAPGTHALQVAERMEVCGLGPDPDPISAGFEQDLQDDLIRERRRLPRPRFPESLKLRRIDTTDNEKRAA